MLKYKLNKSFFSLKLLTKLKFKTKYIIKFYLFI